MPSVRVTNVLLCVVLGIATTVAAQTTPVSQPTLEIQGRQGNYYWVVETAPDGSRRGGWVSAQVPLDRIDRSALQPIPARSAAPASPVQESPEAGTLDERLARIERALAASQTAGSNVAPPPATSVQSAPLRDVEQQPRPPAFTAGRRHPQTREGFWFNGSFGVGAAGCIGCIGREVGPSGGLSLGGTISERVLFGVGTTGWYKSVDGVTVNGGTFDARIRFYPSVTSGFFLTGGGGLGTISAWNAFDAVSETGVGALFGLGWDIRVRPNMSLTPFYNGFAVGVTSGTYYVDQFGLGITIH